MNTYKLTSSQSKTYSAYVIPSPSKSNIGLIVHPGAFEDSWGDKDRYKKIALWLQHELTSHPHIIGYQTSRKKIKESINSKYGTPAYWDKKEQYWKNAFKGKVFDDELEEVKLVCEKVLSGDLGIEVNEIWSLGFSLGGTLALLTASIESRISKLCMVGSAVSTRRENLPVLRGYWSKEKILDKVKLYEGRMKIIQGTADTVVPLEDAVTIMKHAILADSISLTRYKGATHMFYEENDLGLAHKSQVLAEVAAFFGVQ